jgi:alpha-mannosidase
MKKLHLLCNAHLDPVWQWEWEEGAAVAISTFRTAVRFCGEYDGFVFNHNEAILYKWVEEYEPVLFRKIQELAAQGKWNIIGGWYLQPDCNMPSGESLVRQILEGRSYFAEKFGVKPSVAVSFDAFGHSRGLVQILKKSGYDAYLFMRPMQEEARVPARDFLWVGFDGSEILAHRITDGYSSLLGHAGEKVTGWLDGNGDQELGLVPWGVGNHGGGPSRIDLEEINRIMEEHGEREIVHSTPEAYFKDLVRSGTALRKHDRDLNPWAAGCYTSQIRIKQKHRLLENEIYSAEKMLSSASMQGFLEYPEGELKEALHDLLISEFHDILPGTSVQLAEEASLRLLDHGLEIASRLKARAFFALASGQEAAKEGEIPLLVYNPHPFKVREAVECEFMLADQNWTGDFSLPVVLRDGQPVPSQTEKENGNISLDWRKRVVFAAELEPSCMNRFDCRIRRIAGKPEPELKEKDGCIRFRTEELEFVINCRTGLADSYKVYGEEYLKENAFSLLVMKDDDDPWGMNVSSFRKLAGRFRLMSKAAGTKYSGLKDLQLDSVRMIEDGEVRSVIEAVFRYGHSFACMTYKLPKRGTEVQLTVTVNWNEKGRMLKLSIPTALEDARYIGQTAYGVEALPSDGNETVSQKWSTVVSPGPGRAFTCINDGVYGSDFKDGECRISLLRSPGYCGHPIPGKPIMARDRFSTRIDLGERRYSFRLNAGAAVKRLEAVDREALVYNERPYVLSFFPEGRGRKPQPAIILEDEVVQLSALKEAENGKGYIIRLFEPTGTERTTTVSVPVMGIREEIRLKGFEIKTLRLDTGGAEARLEEVDLTEEKRNG